MIRGYSSFVLRSMYELLQVLRAYRTAGSDNRANSSTLRPDLVHRQIIDSLFVDGFGLLFSPPRRRRLAPFSAIAGKTKTLGGAKQKQQKQQQLQQQEQQEQQEQQRKPRPAWQRLLPLLVSGPLLQGLSSSFLSSFGAHDDRVLFAALCFMGGAVLVEAFRSASAMFGGPVLRPWADAAVSHFRGNASG